MSIYFLELSIISLSLIQCTTIGFHEKKIRESMDFREFHEFRVCTFHEPGINSSDIEDLFKYWNDELSLYKLRARPVRVIEINRPGFTGFDIMQFLYNQRLDEGCDRLLYLKGRKVSDLFYEVFSLGVLFGIGIKVEMQGAVDSRTHTRGYIKAKYISTIQLIFTSPKSTLVHEGYHLLGCGHQLFMEACYKKIQTLKKLNEDPNKEEGFFPSVSSDGKEFIDRKQVQRGISN
ncbi:MAG: hypothetical protein JJT78_11680 [Leptospira sp.]|nr:hypothetical protein [Leptospira sp.]